LKDRAEKIEQREEHEQLQFDRGVVGLVVFSLASEDAADLRQRFEDLASRQSARRTLGA
jgi:hypothetical protein